MPFCFGVGLVILSIFIYGAKPEEVGEWVGAVAASVGLKRKTEYKLVAHMEPVHADAEAGGEGSGDSPDGKAPSTPITAASTPAANSPTSNKKADDV